MAAAGIEELAALRPRIVRYLARLVGAPEAEDLAQTVLIKATESLGSFRGDAQLSTWVYRIATNAALDRLRSAAFGQEIPQESEAPSAEASAIREEMNACIREYVEHLPEHYRVVLALSEFEGFSNREIADILGISLDNVKIRLHRGREQLRQSLGAGCSLYRDSCNELACDRKP